MYFKQLIEDVTALRQKVDRMYIYGAGFYGQDVYRVLERNQITVDGFLVTKSQKERNICGLPVIQAEDVLNDKIGIVIGLSDLYTEEVMDYLKNNQVDMEYVINGGKYITESGGREELRKSPTLEITVVLGCSVNCRYCPQDVMVREYFKHDKSRKRIMSVEDFSIFLKHTPNDCDIMFAGMAEPYLNQNCVEMLKMACQAGRRVSLYTTLVGASEQDVEETLKQPIHYVTLHVADKYGYAHVPLTEEYYRNVTRFISARKSDGSPFVDFVNAQAEPDERVAEICKGKYEIMTSVQDRAGNLEDENLQKRDCDMGKNEKIMCCFCGPELTNNVVLPDGTLLLCNMDYGMQHVLGNLLEEDYGSIRSGGELFRVFDGMNGNGNIDVLCRKCLLARKAKAGEQSHEIICK